MKSVLLLMLTFALISNLPDHTTDQKETLTSLLIEFLEGASVNSFEIHNRFWDDDLIYTSAAGERFGKAEIMAGLSSNSSEESVSSAQYSAEEIQIQLYGDMAIVAFRLVAEISDLDGLVDEMHFYNTGTFKNRDGEWRAVAWQATRID
ncbi:MAG: nuclear transport factor 2 family protein [Balneolaceae bacterium]|nr:nuclear transport factor 2 family protein [Balneolaceae bacterium]